MYCVTAPGLQRAEALGNVTRGCQEFEVSRTLFHRWRKRLLRYGPDSPASSAGPPTRWPRQLTPVVEHAVLAHTFLRPTQGPARMMAQCGASPGRWRVGSSGCVASCAGLQTRWERLTRLKASRRRHAGSLSHRGLGWSSKVQTPGSHWTN